MHILVLQETDWLTRGPHTQHHIFERLSKNPSIKITVIDYDIDKISRAPSLIIPRHKYVNVERAVKNSKVTVIRTGHIQIPYFRRITSLITNFFEILLIIKKNRPNLIVGFSMTNGFIGLCLAKLFKIPYIFYYIDLLHKLVTITSVQGIARIVTRFLLKFSDQVIVQTKFHEHLVISEGANPQRVKELPQGVSLENIVVNEEKLNKLKQKFLISGNDFVIFFMGFLYDFAGLIDIINFYNDDVKAGKFKLKFLILGDGGIYTQIQDLVNKIRADWVILAGRVPFFDIAEYIQLADLCLLSFDINAITKEIIPIKIFEYMAMKKPVLSNSLPAVVYELRNSDVIFAKNQNELITTIKDLIPQKEKLKEKGQKCYNLVKEKYVWESIISDFKEIALNLWKKKI